MPASEDKALLRFQEYRSRFEKMRPELDEQSKESWVGKVVSVFWF
jgi:hypothetical protein